MQSLFDGVISPLSEEVRFANGVVKDTNFGSYDLPRFSWLPRIETVILDSPGLAAWLNEAVMGGASEAAYIIGGPLGLDPQIIERADLLLSFSSMTFPHQMMRVILLEQIYRSYRIMHGEPYHK